MMLLMKLQKKVGDLPTIYCDMDMVLCDFIGGTEEVLGVPFPKADKTKRWRRYLQKRFLGNIRMDAWCSKNVVFY